MFFKFFYKRWPLARQVEFLKKKAIFIGSRTKEARRIYIYMYRDLFAEVLFINDDPEQAPESARMVNGLNKLNDYLEKEFKTTF